MNGLTAADINFLNHIEDATYNKAEGWLSIEAQDWEQMQEQVKARAFKKFITPTDRVPRVIETKTVNIAETGERKLKLRMVITEGLDFVIEHCLHRDALGQDIWKNSVGTYFQERITEEIHNFKNAIYAVALLEKYQPGWQNESDMPKESLKGGNCDA